MNEINHKIFPQIFFFSVPSTIHIFHNLDGRSVRAFPIICLCSANKIYWLPFIALFKFFYRKRGINFMRLCALQIIEFRGTHAHKWQRYERTRISNTLYKYCCVAICSVGGDSDAQRNVLNLDKWINWIATTETPVTGKLMIKPNTNPNEKWNRFWSDPIPKIKKIVIENPISVCRWKYVCFGYFPIQCSDGTLFSVGRKPLQNRFERAFPKSCGQIDVWSELERVFEQTPLS